MTAPSQPLVRDLLERWIEHHVVTGEELATLEFCAGDSGLAAVLDRYVAGYRQLREGLEKPVGIGPEPRPQLPRGAALPAFAGFRTVEALGRGGGGEVYRLEDEELGRSVAGKIVRRDTPLAARLDSFLDEARALALFDDDRIVRLLEYRSSSEPPLLIMEFVDGFRLDEVAASLDWSQRARILAEVAEAVAHAHSRGVRHNDLKPVNILVDRRLRPKILDFGLAMALPELSPGGGTVAYMAPERLDPARGQPDQRSDVYSLGVVLYELLCSRRPFEGADEAGLIRAILAAAPPLPIELEPRVPEPLQAIALKALEPLPADRYPSAGDLARDLRRYLEGRAVEARPSRYRSVLGHRLGRQLAEIREWLELKLIYPHEADRLARSYRRLEARDEDWIVESRVLTPARIALYLGAFLAASGSLLYLVIRHAASASGWLEPTLFLGAPCATLAWLGARFGRSSPRVAVACWIASLGVLPFFALVMLGESGIAPPRPSGELLVELEVSNRQLQLAMLLPALWAGWLALRTRTVGLASAALGLGLLFYIGVLGDFGLRAWFEGAQFDRIGLGLLPFVVASWLAGLSAERAAPWFCAPAYLLAAAIGLTAIEMLAVDGVLVGWVGMSLRALQSAEVSDPTLLDTVAGMVANGGVFAMVATAIERRGSQRMQSAAGLLWVVTPFALLKPLLYLCTTGEYSVRFDWLLLASGVAVVFWSRVRQRKSFYYAGLFSIGGALWQLTEHHQWWERTGWGGAVVFAGVATLVLGLWLDRREHDRRSTSRG